MTPPRRKKWTEVEERTLIEKYGEMERDRTLAKMKTREKKYKPIALHVNSVHHFVDPIAYPWQWTWKDVSTKVQNMRHQYALVKQKIKKHSLAVADSGLEEFDWVEGLTHWSNFSRYREVFGDVSVNLNGHDMMVDAVAADPNIENGDGFDNNGMEIIQFGHLGHHHHHAGEGDFAEGFDGGENGVLSLDFDYEGGGEELGEENHNCGNDHPKEEGDDGYVYEDHDHDHEHSNNVVDDPKKKKKRRKVMKGVERKAWGFLSKQMSQLKELEVQLEHREMERERERQMREQLMAERREVYEGEREERERKREEREGRREEVRSERKRELEGMEREMEEREKRRREEELVYEREREERMKRRRGEWKKGIEEMVNDYRAGMGEIHSRMVQEQQNLTVQMLGLISQWTGQGGGIADHNTSGGTSNHYLSQMMVSDMVVDHEEDARVEGDDHLHHHHHHQDDDQFIVDG